MNAALRFGFERVCLLHSCRVLDFHRKNLATSHITFATEIRHRLP